MDPIAIAGMIFSLVMVLLIGGVILLFPISRRLGKFLEVWIEEHRDGDALPNQAMDELRDLVDELRGEVQRLSERQQFVERLLEPRSGARAGAEGAGEDA